MGKIKHHWAAIKAAFIEGIIDEKNNRIYPTLHDLAKKFSVNYGVLRNRASQEHWSQTHDTFMTKVNTVREEKKTEELADERAKFDIDCVKVSRALLVQCSRDLHPDVKLTPSEKAALSQAIKNAQQIGRLGLGDSTEKIDGAGTMVGNKIEVVFVHSPNGQD